MKECEKWLNRDGKDILRPELRNWKGVCSEDGFKKGWRAALERVRDNCIYTEDDGHQCVSQGMIDEELGDT